MTCKASDATSLNSVLPRDSERCPALRWKFSAQGVSLIVFGGLPKIVECKCSVDVSDGQFGIERDNLIEILNYPPGSPDLSKHVL